MLLDIYRFSQELCSEVNVIEARIITLDTLQNFSFAELSTVNGVLFTEIVSPSPFPDHTALHLCEQVKSPARVESLAELKYCVVSKINNPCNDILLLREKEKSLWKNLDMIWKRTNKKTIYIILSKLIATLKIVIRI